MRKTKHSFCFFLLACISFSAQQSNAQQQVDRIVHHARIYTVDSAFSIAQAMAIDAGKIIAIGTDEQILKKYRSKKSLDASGTFIYPGFIDAHCHFTGFATDMWKCNLTGTRSFEEVLQQLIKFSSTNKYAWLYGRGWDQNNWPIKEFPDKQKLDEFFPHQPVFLKRIDGHAALANQAALDLAGITAQSRIDGGSFVMQQGRLTGMLIDNAMDVVEHFIPELNDSLARKFYLKAQDYCFGAGVTGVQDCGVSDHTIQLVDEEQKAGRLKMKIFALLSDSLAYYDEWIRKGIYKTAYLHVGGFKLYADGALGSRGACLLKDYADQPGWKGFLLSDIHHYTEVAEKLVHTPFQLCTHAIGDSANRLMLSIYARALQGKNDKRWRIEHAQVVNKEDIDLFGRFNIIPSVQPTHATSDMYWAGKRLGSDRLKFAYAYKQLKDQNGWIPLGTDFPVEYIEPVKTLYAATVRKDDTGFPPEGFQSENKLSRVETLRGMTIWAAKAAFEEKEKGSLEAGKAADFIITDTDLLDCPDADILKTRILSTFVNGESVFELK